MVCLQDRIDYEQDKKDRKINRKNNKIINNNIQINNEEQKQEQKQVELNKLNQEIADIEVKDILSNLGLGNETIVI